MKKSLKIILFFILVGAVIIPALRFLTCYSTAHIMGYKTSFVHSWKYILCPIQIKAKISSKVIMISSILEIVVPLMVGFIMYKLSKSALSVFGILIWGETALIMVYQMFASSKLGQKNDFSALSSHCDKTLAMIIFGVVAAAICIDALYMDSHTRLDHVAACGHDEHYKV